MFKSNLLFTKKYNSLEFRYLASLILVFFLSDYWKLYYLLHRVLVASKEAVCEGTWDSYLVQFWLNPTLPEEWTLGPEGTMEYMAQSVLPKLCCCLPRTSALLAFMQSWEQQLIVELEATQKDMGISTAPSGLSSESVKKWLAILNFKESGSLLSQRWTNCVSHSKPARWSVVGVWCLLSSGEKSWLCLWCFSCTTKQLPLTRRSSVYGFMTFSWNLGNICVAWGIFSSEYFVVLQNIILVF